MERPGIGNPTLDEANPEDEIPPLPETITEPVGWLLYEAKFGNDKYALAAAAAAGLLTGLQFTENALATGVDVHLDGMPSQQVVDHILEVMIDDHSPEGYGFLFDSLAQKGRRETPHLRVDLLMFLSSKREQYGIVAQTQEEEIRAQLGKESLNYRLFIHKLSRLCAEHLYEYWDQVSLPFESGSKEWLELQVFADFCRQYGGEENISKQAINPRDEWRATGQVQRRLMKQVEASAF